MSVTIPEKVYVGFQGRRGQDEVPLGFMTPYTDDEAGKKRQATVDQWAGGRGYGANKTFNSVIIDNEPMYGFRLGRAIRRSGHFGSGASYVRIEDPRGFELEISIENLVAVLEDVAMERCEFVGALIWGRVAGSQKNLLMAVDSDLYRGAVKTKAAVAQALPCKDFSIGDKIEAVTGETGIYMGMMFGVADGWKEPETMSGKKPVLKVTYDDDSVEYVGFVDLKGSILEKHTGNALTVQDSENEIAAALAVNQFICDYKGTTDVIAWFAKKPHIISTHKAVGEEQMHVLFDNDPSSYSYFKCRMGYGTEYTMRRDDNRVITIQKSYHYSSQPIHINIEWDKVELAGHKISSATNSVDYF